MATLVPLQYIKALACILQLLLLTIHAHSSSSCFPSDLQALTSFAAALHAPLLYPHHANSTSLWDDLDYTDTIAMNESWNTQRDCCSWQGVTCTTSSSTSTSSPDAHPRVTALSLLFEEFSVSSPTILESLCNLPLLSTLQLILSLNFPSSGAVLLQIPECLGEQLPLLQVLLLSHLNLTGPIPSSFSRLFQLQHLDLSFNPYLHGPLLPLLHLPSLTSLSLDDCHFSGPLPTFSTPFLQTLALSGNQLNSTLDQLITLTALTNLHLSFNSISGPIPSSISNLVHLQSLSLAHNSLSGPIPDSTLCELINLTTLDLSFNNFTGPFPPCIGHLSSLASLDLSSNHFAGPIPDEWQNLQNLEDVHLGSGNSLQGTGLPEWLFRFPNLEGLRLTSLGLQSEDVLCSTRVSMLNTSLQMLDLSGNNITGSDLLECFALHNFSYLEYVSLSENPLSISLSHIQPAPSILYLSMSSCNLTGFLNDKVLEGRFSLVLSHNNLVGKIPTKHTNLTTMESLDLSNNYFTGFDSAYSSFQSLDSIGLSNNNMAGDVSTVLQSLGLNCTNPEINSWEYLDLSYNHLVGQIPASLAGCANKLSSLYLDNNNLSGIIPGNLGKLKDIYAIRLNNNHLKGPIPTSMFMSGSLAIVEVSHNDLEGDLKTIFSKLKGPSNPLVVLGLAHNRISGSIPPFLGSFTPSLRVIDISYNSLTGKIPRDLQLPSFQHVEISTYGDVHEDFKATYEKLSLVIKGVEYTLEYVWNKFRFLDLSANHLEGAIPSKLGDLSAMMHLNLSHNNLSGCIPEALGKLWSLETLDLSFNKLQGHIPSSLSSLTKLSVFNVSYNEALEGSIPLGSQLDNNESYIGDTLLCSSQVLQRACQVVDDTLTTSNNRTIKNKVATWMDEWVAMPGLALGIVVGFFGILWLLHGPRLP